MHCNGNIILEKPLDCMHCVASRFGYPNYRLSELSLVPISSDNRRSTVIRVERLDCITINNGRFYLFIYGFCNDTSGLSDYNCLRIFNELLIEKV